MHTHIYALHVEVRPVEGIQVVSLHTDTCVLWPLSTINHCFLAIHSCRMQLSCWVEMATMIAGCVSGLNLYLHTI